jgi:D-3-phosphoglycerate dehydrogenase
VELYEKTVGIVGLGRIGVLVAQRLAAFGTNVIAYDPYVQPGRAAQMGVRLVGSTSCLRESDFVSVHLPKTPETVGLIGAEQLRQVKPSVIVVNAARGGSSTNRHSRQRSRKAGSPAAGIDVFATEPCTDSPSSSSSACGHTAPRRQHRRGAGEGRSSRWPGRCGCSGRRARADAVNVKGRRHRRGRPPRHPAREKLGRVFTALAAAAPASIDVEVRGEIAAYDVKVLELAALKGVFTDITEDPVSYVNAPVLAADRGIDVRLTTDHESPDYRNLVTVRGTLTDGTQISVSGTLTGPRHVEKIVDIDGFDIDITPPSTWPCSATRTARASSARWDASSATPRSTSPACRWAARPRAVTPWSCSRSTRRSRTPSSTRSSARSARRAAVRSTWSTSPESTSPDTPQPRVAAGGGDAVAVRRYAALT